MSKPFSIPAMGLIGVYEVSKKLGITVAKFRTLRRAKDFPKPVDLGPNSGSFWKEIDIKRYISTFKK